MATARVTKFDCIQVDVTIFDEAKNYAYFGDRSFRGCDTSEASDEIASPGQCCYPETRQDKIALAELMSA